jgi:hypothetical protein
MDINISNTIKEYTEIKGNYGDSVGITNNIFASIVIFGIVGCYFTLIFVKSTYNNVYTYIDSVCALLLMFLYTTNISIITRIVNNIKNLIDSTKFISIFLNKSSFASVRGDTYNDYKKTPLSSPLRNMEIMKDMNEKSMNEKSKSIPKLNINLDNIKNKIIIMDNIEQNENDNDQNKKLEYIKNISVRSMVTTTENGISLDWIILYNKLSDPWERFVVCGFEINDSQLFQQLLSMAISFLGLLEISKLIQ